MPLCVVNGRSAPEQHRKGSIRHEYYEARAAGTGTAASTSVGTGTAAGAGSSSTNGDKYSRRWFWLFGSTKRNVMVCALSCLWDEAAKTKYLLNYLRKKVNNIGSGTT